MNKPQRRRKTKPAKRVKRSARVVFAGGEEFHTTAKQFWSYVGRGVVRCTSEKPLTGEVLDEVEFRLITVGHTVLDAKAQTHLTEVLTGKRNIKRKKHSKG